MVGTGTVVSGVSRYSPAPWAGSDRVRVPVTVPRAAPDHRSVTAADPIPRSARFTDTCAAVPSRLNRATYRSLLPGTSATHACRLPP
ncbi:hypothetical protein PSN01_02336 [Micromonospora saelicesensis]|nr:hypothetical protein PSN01_02336 [Micromonospora saelicesensis]